MRRVQKHFGIPSSSIAQSDIDERKHERINDWVVETETVVEEEEEEPLDTAGGSIQQTEPSRSRRQQSEYSIQLPGSTHSGRQSPNHSRISNSSTLASVTKKTSSTNNWWTGIIGGFFGARKETFPSNSVEMRTSSAVSRN